MFWDKKTETLKPDDLKSLQLKRLKKTISLVQNVEFYRKRLAGAGIKPSSIKTLDDIKKIPFTRKQDLREGYPFGFFAVPKNKIVRIHTTSGTTGKPTVVGYTRKDLDMWSDLIARNMTMIGVTGDDVFQNMVNYGMFTGGLGFHYGAEKIGMMVIPSATGNTKRQIEMIQDFGVTTIHGLPAMRCTSLRLLKKWAHLLIASKQAFLVPKHGQKAVRKTLENKLGLTVDDSYGLSELFGPGVAFECPERDGLHIWHDSYLVEIIDPKTGEQLSDGERGELVVTPLVKEAMPLLKYRTGDVTMLMEDDCLCKRGKKIARITGRSDDMLVIRGINVFPSQIEHYS